MNTAITYHLEPGFIFVGRDKAVIRTVVGSCVAVCIWDRRKKCGGMNHYVYPETKQGERSTAQFGNAAVPKLVHMMFEMGCRKADLVAQIFGGGHPLNIRNHAIGERNVAVAREILEKKGIRIVSQDVGGSMGRKILFDTDSGHVAVLKVHQLRDTDWLEDKRTR